MVKSSVEKLSREIGFDIGNSDDITQANLLNGLGDALGYLTEQNLETQMCYVAQKMNKESIKVFKRLYEYIRDK